VRRVAIIASASGNGKTTLGRALATRLGVRFVELDALVHGPGWAETPDEELKAILAPILAEDGWVIDGNYTSKLGTLVLDAADTVVWLDLPTRVWLPRLVRRTWRRVKSHETLWNGNTESWRDAVWGRNSLFGYALTQQPRRRRQFPQRFAGLPVVRLRSPRDVERWMAEVQPGTECGPGAMPRR